MSNIHLVKPGDYILVHNISNIQEFQVKHIDGVKCAIYLHREYQGQAYKDMPS